MKHLIIIAQKIDSNDDHRGFFIDWVKEFSQQFEKVSVITVAEGIYDLPQNVRVYSLGKEKGASKVLQAFRFYRYLFRLAPSSDGIFAHSSPIFVVAAWPIAALLRKKIVLWYLHRSVTFKLKLAEMLCYKIVTATAGSLGLKSSKIVETGHGISVAQFKTERTWVDHSLKILSVGRITKIKNYETLLHAARILKDKGLLFPIKIIGQPVIVADVEYKKSLMLLREELDIADVIEFIGLVPYYELPRYYREADVVVGLTPHGGIDKALLEGMAAGCLIVTSNDVNKKYFGSYSDQLVFAHGDSSGLAQKLIALFQKPGEDKKAISNFMVQSVSEHHNLHTLVKRIKNLYE